MKLYTFEINGQSHLGAELDGQLGDLNAAHAAKLASEGQAPAPLAASMLSLLRGGSAAMQAARDALAFAAKRPAVPVGMTLSYPLNGTRLLAPIPRPGKILCSGINYRGHLNENPGARLPDSPFFFSKLPTAVIGPGQPIVKPKHSQQVDYEIELAAVFNKTAKRGTTAEEVMDCVAGYTILHDVSARDVQFKDSQITLGKNFDTFCPLGPCLVTKDEIPDPTNLKLKTWVNGQLLQDSSTADWVFPLPRLLAALAAVMTLEPGDVVSTGCPAGVGYFRKPQLFLKAGDVCRLEIDRIGVLENSVADE